MLTTKRLKQRTIKEKVTIKFKEIREREGNPYASSYYSKAGLGGNGAGYGLNGRSLQSNGAVTQECNEEGTVVVGLLLTNKETLLKLRRV